VLEALDRGFSIGEAFGRHMVRGEQGQAVLHGRESVRSRREVKSRDMVILLAARIPIRLISCR
jgi:hypothetical protein